jgi:hypothetical protein
MNSQSSIRHQGALGKNGQSAQEIEEAITERCIQCHTFMNPVEAVMNLRCGACIKHNRKRWANVPTY